MSRSARLIAVLVAGSAGAILVASLAFVSVLPGWGLLFFYALPSSFIAIWSAHELVPSWWRNVATPVRRRWRLSRFGAPPPLPPVAMPPPRELVRSRARHRAPIAVGARLWLRGMRPVFSMLRSRRGRRIRDAAVVISGLALVALVLRGLTERGWPAGQLEPVATAAACSFFLSTFALRALGWQRLFRPVERPRSLVLAMSIGMSEVVSLALPPRIGDAIGVSIVRKLTPRAPSIGTTVLSLFVLGLMDISAVLPLAVYALVSVHATSVRIAMLVIVGVGIGAAGVAAILPSVRTSERLTRRGFGHWLALHAPIARLDALWSWCLVCGSWLTRAAALLLLLDALGLHPSFAIATAYVAAGAGANALPVGPAGAATEAGAGAAVLAGAGVSTAQAIALAVTAQGLTVAAGATIALLGASLRRARRRVA